MQMTQKLITFFACFLFVQGNNFAAHSSNSLAEETSKDFTKVAREAIPAVVSIQVKSKSPSSRFSFGNREFDDNEQNPFNDDIFRFFFGPRKEGSQPTLGQATGVIVNPKGYILTNSHVVKDATEIKVILNDGTEFIGKLIGQDPNTDIAVVKIDAENLPFLKLGNSDDMEIGQWAIAIGNPFGLKASLTVGVISAKGRNNLDLANVEDFIQTDAAINRGNSGGPLLNLDSKIIGLNTAIVSGGTGGYVGVGFAIPSNIIKHIMDQIITNGTVTRGFIGVTLQQVDHDLAQAFGLKQASGAVIAEVSKDSPADKAGLKQGDIVQLFNKTPVKNIASLRNAIALMPPGQKIVLNVLRSGTPKEVVVEVGSYPSSTPKIAQTSGNKLGFEVQDITPELAKTLNLSGETGVVISRVDPNSTAAWAGLKKGAVIFAVNQRKISSVDEFNAILQDSPSGKPILFLIKVDDAVRYVSIRVE